MFESAPTSHHSPDHPDSQDNNSRLTWNKAIRNHPSHLRWQHKTKAGLTLIPRQS